VEVVIWDVGNHLAVIVVVAVEEVIGIVEVKCLEKIVEEVVVEGEVTVVPMIGNEVSFPLA